MTDEEIEELRETIITEGAEGITSASVDGMTVSLADAAKRLDLLDRLEHRNAARARGPLPIGLAKIVSRGLQ